ncbi:MAG TPA: hypothetical protein VF047_02310 [Nitrososphaeraceae archaeon]
MFFLTVHRQAQAGLYYDPNYLEYTKKTHEILKGLTGNGIHKLEQDIDG